VLIVLLLLAIPPVLAGTYAGAQSVDASATDAAKGMGMTTWQVLWNVQIPCAVPLMMSGIRSATLQVVASLTVAAYAPLVGGLGRFIVDGNQNLADLRFGYPAMVSAGLAIAVLAVCLDAGLAALERAVTSPGVRQRSLSAKRRNGATRQPRFFDASGNRPPANVTGPQQIVE
jgi:osmoprotectant transport system permease protein